MEFAASCRPLRKSNSKAVATSAISSSWMCKRSPRLLGLFDGDPAYAVGDVFETIHDALEVIVDFRADDEVHGVAGAVLHIEFFDAKVMQAIGTLLKADDFFRDGIEPHRLLAHRTEKRNRIDRQLCGVDDDIAHLRHVGLKAGNLEQDDCLGCLLHLVDGVVQSGNEFFDIAAVEWRDERSSRESQNIARDDVSLIFEVHDSATGVRHARAGVEQFSKGPRAVHKRQRMLVEKAKKAVLSRHQSLEPSQHSPSPPPSGTVMPPVYRI